MGAGCHLPVDERRNSGAELYRSLFGITVFPVLLCVAVKCAKDEAKRRRMMPPEDREEMSGG